MSKNNKDSVPVMPEIADVVAGGLIFGGLLIPFVALIAWGFQLISARTSVGLMGVFLLMFLLAALIKIAASPDKPRRTSVTCRQGGKV